MVISQQKKGDDWGLLGHTKLYYTHIAMPWPIEIDD